jgi:signal peptidase I
MTEKKPEGNSLRRTAKALIRELIIPIGMALLVVQFVLQAFKIPSASMENSLLVGDFLLGVKFVYGAPLPYSEARLPSISDPKPGTILIFRYPGDPDYPEGDRERYRMLANLLLFGNVYWDSRPKPGQNRLVWYAPKDFIKRCVAESGQLLEVADTVVKVDGKVQPLPPRGLYREDRGSEPIRDKLLYRIPAPGDRYRLDTLSIKEAVWIRSLAHQENPGKKVELRLDLLRGDTVDNDYVFPYLNGSLQDRNHMAALALLGVPLGRAGNPSRPYLHAENIPFSRVQEVAARGFIRLNDLIPGYEDGQGRRVEQNDYYIGSYLDLIERNLKGQQDSAGPALTLRASIVIDGKVQPDYQIQYPAYFMMGDNRDNSSDSRYFGPLSRRYVKAKAFIIYYSLENEDSRFSLGNPFSWPLVFTRTRWSRIGKLIE